MSTLAARKLKELYGAVASSDRILIVLKPDPDALSSAWALKRLLVGKVQSCRIAHVGEIQRMENRAMVELLKIRSERFDKIDPSSYTVCAVVDGQPDHFTGLSMQHMEIVIDHHPVVNTFDARFTDLRPKIGATATMLTGYLQAAGVKIPRPLATALCFGIKTDTNGLTRATSRYDVEAYSYLLPIANMKHLRQIEDERISRSDHDLLSRAIDSVRIRKKLLFTFPEGPVPPDSLVILADTFIGVAGISVAAVASTYRGRVVVILRGRGPRTNVGRIVRGAFAEYGSAGGHEAAARAECKLSAIPEAVAKGSSDEIGIWVKKQIQANLSGRAKKTNGKK